MKEIKGSREILMYWRDEADRLENKVIDLEEEIKEIRTQTIKEVIDLIEERKEILFNSSTFYIKGLTGEDVFSELSEIINNIKEL